MMLIKPAVVLDQIVIVKRISMPEQILTLEIQMLQIETVEIQVRLDPTFFTGRNVKTVISELQKIVQFNF